MLVVSILSALCADAFATGQDATASADDPPAAEQAAGKHGRTTELQTVLVTAEKRQANLQKTSIAVEVVDAQTMQEQHRKTASELLAAMPGVAVQDSAGGPQFSVRSIGATGRPGGEQSVPIYRDGVYFDRVDSARSMLLDVARVEVLKGPQGTLFGRNALGGAVNVIYNQPKLGTTEGAVSLGVGNYALREGDAVINLPIGQDWALRAAFSRATRDGYLSNGRDDQDDSAARIKLRWHPSEVLDVVLTAEQDKLGGKGNGTADVTDDWPDRSGWKAWYDDDDAPVYKDSKIDVLSLQLDWTTPLGVLSVIPAHLTSRYVADQVQGGVEQIERRTKTQDSLEVRLVSDPGSPVQWQFGGYYYDADEPQSFTTLLGPYTNGYPIDLTPRNWTRSLAAFGQATLPLAEAWRLVLGARYTRDRRTLAFASGDYSNGGTGTLLSRTYDYSRPTYKLGVEWDASAASMLYANISTGYRSGDVEGSSSGISAGKMQLLTQYALGYKSRFFDNRLQFNAELYYDDYRNFPVALSYQASEDAFPETYAASAKNLTIKGLDLDLVLNLSIDDRIDFGTSFMHARFGQQPAFADSSVTDADEFAAFARQLASYSGATKQQAPSVAFTLGYHHFFGFANGGQLDLNPNLQYSSEYYVSALTEDVNDVRALQPAFFLYNVYLNYTAPSGGWGIGAYGKNLSNEAVITNFTPGLASGAVDSVNLAAPRTFGVQGWWRF
ncbi:MAG: TonB-dependent receptor [Pseudomonas sp.]